jgi:uncharacterized protein YciI
MSVPVTTLFALEYRVVDDYVARRAAFRDAHLRLAQAAHARGELRLGGALGDPPERALLVFSSREAAETFAAQDPYVVNGLVSRWEVRPWAVAVGAGLLA